MGPLPNHFQDFTGGRGHDVADHGYEIALTIDLDPGNGVAGFFTGKGDSFDLSGKFHQLCPFREYTQ